MSRWRRKVAEFSLAVVVAAFLVAGAAFTASALLQPPKPAAAPAATLVAFGASHPAATAWRAASIDVVPWSSSLPASTRRDARGPRRITASAGAVEGRVPVSTVRAGTDHRTAGNGGTGSGH